MLPKTLLGEKPVQGVVSVAGSDFVLWTHLRKGQWLIGLTNVAEVFQETFDVAARHKADEPNTSQQNYGGHFADAVLAGSTHVEQAADGSGVVLSVWRHGLDGSQVRAEYVLKRLAGAEQRTRIVHSVAVEMAKQCVRSSVADDEELKRLRQLCERHERELAQLRRAAASAQAGDDGDGPNWSLGTAKQRKPKRAADGTPVVASPTKRTGRDLVNPSLPAPKKGKAIKYKGLPELPASK
jgi:hypothetical protein